MSPLSDSQWSKIKDIPPGKPGDPGRTGCDNRRFVEAIMWIGRNGARWRALPACYGNWNSVHRRFRRRSKKGVWQMAFNAPAANADTEWLMLDATIVRAHQPAAGAKGGKKMRDSGGVAAALRQKSTPTATVTATWCGLF
jgi:transposase